ncbi:MAG: hypothetical protein AAGA29_07375 [Planctomycetota bacterium]
MQDIAELFPGLLAGLFLCWLLPLGALGGLILIGGVVRSAWRARGLEPGGLYCAGCRFDLRGCASWNCPECGAHLDDGRVLTAGNDPPMGLFARMLLVSLAVAGPLVFAGVLGAVVWPGNYEVDRTLRLIPVVHGPYAEFYLEAQAESSWFGRGRPEMVRLRNRWIDHSPTRNIRVRKEYDTPLPGSDTVLLPDELWERIETIGSFQYESAAWRDGSRTEFVAWMRYAAAEGPKPDSPVKFFRVNEQTYRLFELSVSYVLVAVVLGLLAWGFVLRWVVRWYDRVQAGYARAYARVHEQLEARIERNRAGAGLGGAGSES